MSSTRFIAADIHDAAAMRQAGADLLSLALLDARNRTLQWLTLFDGVAAQTTPPVEFDPPAWLIGQAGRFQELWISRHLQRGRGEACDHPGVRLSTIDPVLDWWLDPAAGTRAQRWAGSVPGAEAMRAYLAETLEGTLELLDKAEASDPGLYFFRIALAHEDRLAETLAEVAQHLGLALPPGLAAELPVRARRDALWFPSQRVQLGTPPGGFVPDGERHAHELTLPEFEIDAQAVCWAQFAEFAEDGGYDDEAWWSAEGWQWLQADGRRAPRYVEQLGGGVLVHRAGRLQRVPGVQAVLHLSVHEAEAWCRWAGRRLPTEAEWACAVAATGRGFVWGDVFEWVAGRARDFPGYRRGPTGENALPDQPGWRVLRGASYWTAARQRHPAARRFLPPTMDAAFAGFRSCAI
ncbi:SUMF1/EgtB/PvdO family nonheme iron enzyme [Aquincola sp. S2]|uniref:SUMF1/EgtB/PvdO family nonheme iron enzyme n=1 Tax=Pseudaquabacterium terrae TaxID=2732868 RepID=A0ABX2EPQ2_9BURK|nr:SUMF1/EgtB/PvdO family nonheme iron enzyme [Aquabacterium terrae]NRF70680.1 SUMF1/EgtB/PvdO family nonheme iron enzyme [Aquabacterium terrae]